MKDTKTQLEFSAYSLLHKDKNGKITGAMSPILFANHIAQNCGFKYNRLARLNFKNNLIHQVYEGRGKSELTGYDTLVMAAKYSDGNIFMNIIIDLGSSGVCAAMCYKDEEPEIIPVYENQSFETKLNLNDFKEIFTYLFTNFEEVFEIKEG